jgi:VWFA-related protein
MGQNRVIQLTAALIALLIVATTTERGVTALSGAGGQPPPASVRITSPLGRTGLAGRVRIVAQVVAPAGVASVRFMVDNQLVGTVTDGPPFAVDWTDVNPFERRTIVVEAFDATGASVRDSVVLPPFEVTDKTEVTSVLLETGVYDKGGKFVSQMNPSTFVVREDGVQQAIDQVGREVIPATMVLLVDSSQSMSRRMEFVQLAAARLATALRSRDKLIVAPFTTSVGSITGPTDDPATISEAIGALKAKGGTAIFDALLTSTKLLEGIDGRRAVILITDGYDENSSSTFEDVLKAAEAANVTVYVVGIGGVAGISLKGESLLRTIADETGGRIFFPPREPDLVPIASSVASDAHSRYLLTYTPKNQKKDGRWREVSVEVPEGYRVRTRSGYFAPAPAPIRPTLEFTVTDNERHFVDVTADDLEVVEDGVAQSVDTFQEAVDPVSIVMALDSSGSMKKSAEAVQRAAREFVLAVRPEDSLALITFADKPLFAHVLASNRQWSLDAIDKYQPNGGTALYDALYNSLLHLKGVPGRHAIVVLTDGKDENNPGTAPGSEHTLDDVLKLLKTVGATIFPIGLGTKVEVPVLEKLATASGGEAYFPTDVSLLDAQYRRVVENLRRRYVLSYTSSNVDHDGEWRSVEIRTRATGLTVASGGGYFAPAK